MREIDPALDRLPPQNVEAEQSVLGAILLDNEAISKSLEIISPEDFYRESHRRIFDAMLELYEKNEAIDLITVTDVLKRKGELESVGGVTNLSAIAGSVPTAANVRYHAKIVKEKALMRGLLNASNQIASMVYESSSAADELVDQAESTIFRIADKRTKTSFYTLKEVIKSSFEMIEHLYERKEAITGVPSGFPDLDELTTGFQAGDLVIVGGRPSMGKTAFGLNIAQHVAIEMHEPVAIFSLEMSKEQLALRMLCAEAKVDANSVRKGFIRKEDWHHLTSAAARLADAPIYIDDSSGISVLEMRAKARRLKIEHGGLALVLVDYLQLMKSRGNFERREQEISEISRSLKGLGKELRVPVIALSQLNRAVEQRGEKKPTLADLRESGAIEQDADVIIFLYRDEVYNKNNPQNKGKAEIIIAKQRNGPTDSVFLTFLAHCTRFVPLSTMEYQGAEDVF